MNGGGPVAMPKEPAFFENKRAQELLFVLSQALNTLEITGDPRAVMKLVAERLQSIGLSCLIADYEHEPGELNIACISLPEPLNSRLERIAAIKFSEYRFPASGSSLHPVLFEGRTMLHPKLFQCAIDLLPDLSTSRLERFFEIAGLQKDLPVIYAPLKVENRVVGVLGVWGQGITDVHVHGISAFANQLSLALHYARMYEQVRLRSDDLAHANALIAGLSMAATKIEGARDPERVFENLGDELRKLDIHGIVAELAPDGASLSLRYMSLAAEAVAQAERLAGVQAESFSIPLEAAGAVEVIETGQPAFFKDISAIMQRLLPGLEAKLVNQVQHLLGLSEYTRAIFLPLMSSQRVYGLLTLWGEELRATDLPSLTLFAHQVGAALDNAYLHEETQRQLREQTLLTEAAEIILDSLDITEVAGRLAERLCQAIDATSAYFSLYNLETRSLTVVADHIAEGASPRERISDLGQSYPDPDLVFYNYLLENRLAIEHYDQPDLKLSDREHMRLYGAKSVIYIPLNRVEQTSLGVLEVWETRRKREFTDNELRLCKAISRQAIIAIEKAHLYSLAQQEIRERATTQAQLRRSEEYYRGMFENAHDPVIIYDPQNGSVLQVNQRACDVYGYRREEWHGMSLDDLRDGRHENQNHIRQILDSGRYYNYQALHRRSDGSSIHVEINLSSVDYNGRRAVQSVHRDITDKLQAMEMLKHEAFHDRLTGLPNRALFMDRLERAILRFNRRSDYNFAVLFMDLDRFKNVNDSRGHSQGDALLMEVAARLSKCIRGTDTVARLGGDEFVVLMDDIRDVLDTTGFCERIKAVLSEPIDLNGDPVFTSVSIGVVISDTVYHSPDEYLRDADIALYRAKNGGRGRYEVFDATMREHVMRRLALENDLRRALNNRELTLYYMPIVSLFTGKVTGLEALLRWYHPERGPVLPGEFIEVAEETGLILPIGRWVLTEACRQMQTWRQRYPMNGNVRISINLSGEQINLSDLTDQVRQALDESGLPSACLSLEVTESALIKDVDAAITALSDLKALGVTLQLDDFGTGYSSLSYLRQFPIDVIKIDRSFIMSDSGGVRGLDLVRTIILMGKELGMQVVAEGIETEEQLLNLRELNCPYGQGYIFAAPMEAHAAGDYLEGMYGLSPAIVRAGKEESPPGG